MVLQIAHARLHAVNRAPLPHQKDPTVSRQQSRKEDPPLSFLWNGICEFFNRVFTPQEDKSETQRLREELIAEKSRANLLQKQLKDRDVEVAELKSYFENQVKDHSESMKTFLSGYHQARGAERLAEMKAVGHIMVKHEELVRQYTHVVELYETLRESSISLHGECEYYKGQHANISRSNQELLGERKEWEERAINAEKKVGEYEDFYYGREWDYRDGLVIGRELPT